MDGMFDSKGVKEAIKTNVYRDGYQKRPRLALVGSEGLALNQDLGENHFIAPGYNHLDTISASRKQNLGREEIISIQTAKFISQVSRTRSVCSTRGRALILQPYSFFFFQTKARIWYHILYQLIKLRARYFFLSFSQQPSAFRHSRLNTTFLYLTLLLRQI